MAGTREIKNRIRSIQDTKKITNAMYLISSTKLQRARRELDATRPYFETLQLAIARMLNHMPEVESRYLEDDKTAAHRKRHAYLVITADKGLAGSYNHNVLRLAQQALEDSEHWELYVVGEFGRRYFDGKHLEIEHSFLYTAQNPTLHRAREIAYKLMERYDGRSVEEVRIFYTDMRGNGVSEARSFQLLPFARSHFQSDDLRGEHFTGSYEFYPSLGEVLDQLLPSYLSGFIYSALVDSYCAEQHSRMMAMDAANRNAEEMLRNLRTQYNRVRQSLITQEITEISAGAQAQRKKRQSYQQSASRGKEGGT